MFISNLQPKKKREARDSLDLQRSLYLRQQSYLRLSLGFGLANPIESVAGLVTTSAIWNP